MKPCTIVVSGKGGTGKTTISALLVAAFAEAGLKPVLAVDADPNANLNEALGLTLAETLGGMREEAFTRSIPAGMDRHSYIKYRFAQALVESNGFDLLAMGRPEGSGCYCFPNQLLSECMRLLEEQYRVVIVDAEAGMEHIARGTVRSPDLLLIVSDPGARGLRTAGRIAALAESLGLDRKRMALVVNRCLPGRKEGALPDDAVLPLIAEIPEDGAVAAADLDARPIVSLPADSPARTAVQILAGVIAARCAERR